MWTLSEEKRQRLEAVSRQDGIISALAIDQRGALKKMFEQFGYQPSKEVISEFKGLVSEELTPYASSILLDPEYGLEAANIRDKEAGLLLAYEKTGYDTSRPGRLPDLLPEWSVLHLKEQGADAIKFLLYYDIDDDPYVNNVKHIFVERLGSECAAENMPFFLELLSYDAKGSDKQSKEFAADKPRKVIQMMKEFSKADYKVDVLKVEVPVDMRYVEGFGEEVVYTKSEAMAYFKEQSDATHLPFIFLSAGVSAQLFQDTLRLAHASGSQFNGVLCGRATWKDAVEPFVQNGVLATREWLRQQGKSNINALNEVLAETAHPWWNKLS